MELLASLNAQQRAAASTTDGPLLILAGAGSGKTRVITYRIAYLITEHAVPPNAILAVTFTNKAAAEMRNRVTRLLADNNLSSLPLIATFHSLCVRILRQHIDRLDVGLTRSFTIYDQDDSMRLVKSCVRDLGLDEKQLTPRAALSAISRSKNKGEDAEVFAANVAQADEKRASIAAVYKLYEQRLGANNALDFDDLLIKTVQLLRKVTDVREYYNNRFRYILVDEYQDTNPLQFAMIRCLTEQQQNICVVGDENQSIYRFRQADIRNILKFEEHFANAVTVRLEQNYRSTQNILDAADSVIRHNIARKDKKLWTENAAGDKLRYYQALDSDSEARFVAGMIEEHRRLDPSIRAAVLYRTNAQSRVFEEAMRRARIEYNIVGGFSFYERAEVRDIVSYLKLALNPNDSISLMRIINTPARGLGKQTLDELDRQAKQAGVSHWEALGTICAQGDGFSPRALASFRTFHALIKSLCFAATVTGSEAPVSDLVKAAINDSGYGDALRRENTDEATARLANLEELVNAAVDYDQQEIDGLREFIDHAALASDTDQLREDAKVTLMTIHAAKGLEFPLVFLVGLEDGLFPHARSVNDREELEEERRLCYVAITRAERYLYITHAMKRRVYGTESISEPSQFLNELPLDQIEDLSRSGSWLSFARSAGTRDNQYLAQALSGYANRDTTNRSDQDRRAQTKPRSNYAGKTYDNVQSITDFFNKRNAPTETDAPGETSAPAREVKAPVTHIVRPTAQKAASQPQQGFVPGAHVLHPKYGRGLVLRREGTGDNVKLTVSFAGFGQKKLIEKYAGLQGA